MVGERNVVQVVLRVFRLERTPAAVAALHADHPFARPRYGFAIDLGMRERRRAMHGHDHHRRVVDVRVVVVVVLECPTARPHIRTARNPVAAHVENLQRTQPREPALGGLLGMRLASFEQRVRHERGVPDRRQTRLAICFVILDDEQLVDRLASNRAIRVIGGITEHVVHHHRVRHGRENRAEPVFAVQAFIDEGHRLAHRALARGFREQAVDRAQQHVHAAEEAEPAGMLMRRPIARAGVDRRAAEQLVDAHAARVARDRPLRVEHEQRHDHGTRPVRHLREMERKPHGQQHDLDGHHGHRAPRHHAEQREQNPREHIHGFGAAVGENRLACADHVLGVRRVADHLQREVRLDTRADVERAVGKERPAAVGQLDAAQISADLLLQFQVWRFAEIVDQQHVFGGNRRVGFEFVDPVAVRLLRRENRVSCARDGGVERGSGRFARYGRRGRVRRRVGDFGQDGVQRLGLG